MADNLLDKASILLTPTAYDNGSMLSIKPENGDGDFQFQRNSAATRVNAQGLVENVQIISPELVSNGNFSEIGTEEVLNGNFSQEGSELITNGDFATDSDWTINDWNISGGTLNGSASTGIVFQNNIGVVVGKTYKVVLEISNYTSGLIRFKVGGASYQNIASEDGVQEFYFVASTTANNILFSVQSAYTGSIDNVSVKEVGQNWTLGSGASVGENKLNVDASAFDFFATQTALTNGLTYKVTLDAEVTTGDILLYTGTQFATINSSDSYTFYTTSDSAQIRFRSGGSGFDGSITNISVKEVGQDWVLGSGVSIADSKLTKSDPSVGNTSANQVGVFTIGKTYKYTLAVSGNITASDKVVVFATDFTSAGTYEGYYTAPVTSLVFSLRGSTNVYSIDSISVKEITDDTNIPRINYTDGCGSWLLEPQSTNLVTYSEDFSNNSWTKSSVTLTSGFAAPDGTNNAYKLVEGTNNGSHQIYSSFISGSAGNNYTTSFFVKAAQRTWCRIMTYGGTTVFFDLANGVVGAESNASGKIESLSNGWYKVSSTYVSQSNERAYLHIAESNNTTSYQGNGTSGIYVFGAQVEAQSQATSYVPTSGATNTRLQDIADNSGNSSLINSTEGVLYAEFSATQEGYLSLNDGSSTNRIFLGFAPLSVYTQIRVGGNVSADMITSAYPSNTILKAAIKYKANDFALWVNGVEVNTDNSGATFPSGVLNNLSFNVGGGSSPFYGNTKAIAVYKEALTDAELQSLTTQ